MNGGRGGTYSSVLRGAKKSLREEREKEEIRKDFSPYASPQKSTNRMIKC